MTTTYQAALHCSNLTWELLAKVSRISEQQNRVCGRFWVGEETLTDLILTEWTTLRPETIVRKFNKIQESTSGADWEWWLVEHQAGDYWGCGLRIQAKIIDEKLTYKQLHYKEQRSILSADAKRSRSTPLYILYTYVRPFHGDAPSISSQDGLSIVAPGHLQESDGTKLVNIRDKMKRFSTLFESGDDPSAVISTLNNWKFPEVHNLVPLQDFPAYVQAMLNKPAITPDDLDLVQSGRLADFELLAGDYDDNLAGVVVSVSSKSSAR